MKNVACINRGFCIEKEPFRTLSPYIGADVADMLFRQFGARTREICEVRCILNKPITVEFLHGTDVLENEFKKVVIADFDRINHVVNAVSDGSLYSVNETIKNGFVTVSGGHRIGFCGTAVIDGGTIKHIKDICAVCVRICREVRGCAEGIKNVFVLNGRVQSVLIASPPGCGKTTLLRDACRILGKTFKVGIADERCEIAAVSKGEAQNDVGDRSFVCSGYPKVSAMQMMLRSMSPNVIATDEIGSDDDFAAILAARLGGVSVIATAHALSFEDLDRRYGAALLRRCFDRIIFLKNRGETDKIYGRGYCDF